jgi:hypothetical protein
MLRVISTCLLMAVSVSPAISAVPTAADLLPQECMAYAEIRQPQLLLETALHHPFWQRAQNVDAYKRAVQTPQYRFFLGVVASIETRIEMKWQAACETLFGGGIYAAFDPSSQGTALLIRSSDEQRLQTVLQRLLELVRNDARSKSQDDPLPESDYRGLKVYGRPGARFTVAGPWIIASNRDELGRSIVDAWLDGREESLTGNPRFQQARQAQSSNDTFWSWVDIGTLRDAGPASKLKDGKAQNPGVELIAGGVLEALRQTPFMTVALNISGQATRIEVAVPTQTDWTHGAREFWFGRNGSGAALPLHQTDSTVFSLSTYRDVAEMWLRGGDLFDAATNDGLAQAESTLSTLFGGRDFAEDILRSFSPQYRIVAARQDFEHQLPQPAIKLPAFALITQMRDPETARPELRRTYQSLIGFLNIVGAQNGNPQLDQDLESVGTAQLYTAQFVAEPDEQDSNQARIQFNFSPSIAFTSDHFILASTRQLARQLALELTAEVTASRTQPDTGDTTSVAKVAVASNSIPNALPANTEFRLDVRTLSAILDDNRKQLIAQNMLSDGHSRDEAEQQISLLLFALQAVRDVHFRLTATGGELRASLVVSTPPTEDLTGR